MEVVKTVAVLLIVLATTCLAAADDFPRGEWIEPVNGISTRLVADREVYQEGQYIWVYLDVRNLTDKPVEVGYEIRSGNLLQVLPADGATLRPIPEGLQDLRTSVVQPGKQVSLHPFYINGNQNAHYDPLKPGEYRVLWGHPSAEGVAVDERRAPPAEVRFKVISPPVPQQPDGEPKDVPWGGELDGLRARVRGDKSRYVDGQHVLITYEINNVSDRAINYYRPVFLINNSAIVCDENGNPQTYKGGIVSTSAGMLTINPGETAIIAQLDLRNYYHVSGPGRYYVERRGEPAHELARLDDLGIDFGGVWPENDVENASIPATNRFFFDVVPAEHLEPSEKGLRALFEKLPPGWTINHRAPISNLTQPGMQWSRVPAVLIRIEKEGVRASRQNGSSIWLYLASHRAIEEPWEHNDNPETEYIGSGPFGHLYLQMLPAKVLENWPTMRQDLRKWLQIEQE